MPVLAWPNYVVEVIRGDVTPWLKLKPYEFENLFVVIIGVASSRTETYLRIFKSVGTSSN